MTNKGELFFLFLSFSLPPLTSAAGGPSRVRAAQSDRTAERSGRVEERREKGERGNRSAREIARSLPHLSRAREKTDKTSRRGFFLYFILTTSSAVGVAIACSCHWPASSPRSIPLLSLFESPLQRRRRLCCSPFSAPSHSKHAPAGVRGDRLFRAELEQRRPRERFRVRIRGAIRRLSRRLRSAASSVLSRGK